MTTNIPKSIDAAELFPQPGFDLVDLSCEREALSASSGASDLPCWGKPGWARFTKKVVLTDSKPEDLDELGRLLNAEWIDGGKSARIVPDPATPGLLMLMRFTEITGQSGSYRRQEVTIEGSKVAGGKKLTYFIYYADVGDGEVRRVLDTFQGIGEEASS